MAKGNPGRKGRPLLSAAALLLPWTALAGEVTLNGEGSVRYEPDSARLQFTAQAEHGLPQQASEQVNALMAKWRKSIQAYRDQLKDYSDASVNLYSRLVPSPTRGEEPQRLAVASQTVSFEIHDLSLLNPLLEQAQSLGLDYHLGPHQFFHSNEDNLERSALAKAIADARARCDFVAEQLDQTCGEVVSLQVDGGRQPAPMMMAETRAQGDTVSSAGVREIQTTVNATFKLD